MKPAPTPNEKAFAFLVYFAIIILFIIVFITMFDPNSTWGIWIDKNKDLIVGIYAVGAAALTINQMKRTDSQQEKRHHQMMVFTMRREVMRIRRAYTPQVSEIKLLQPVLSSFLDAFELEIGNPIRIAAVNQPQAFWDAIFEVKEILEREQITDVKELFDEASLRAFQLATDQLQTILYFVSRWKKAEDAEPFDDTESFYFYSYWDEEELYINSRLRALIVNLSAICNQLTALRDYYASEKLDV